MIKGKRISKAKQPHFPPNSLNSSSLDVPRRLNEIWGSSVSEYSGLASTTLRLRDFLRSFVWACVSLRVLRLGSGLSGSLSIVLFASSFATLDGDFCEVLLDVALFFVSDFLGLFGEVFLSASFFVVFFAADLSEKI